MTSLTRSAQPLVSVRRLYKRFLAVFLVGSILLVAGIAHLTRETYRSFASIGPQLARLEAASQYVDRLQQIRITVAAARLRPDLAARQDFDGVLEGSFKDIRHFADQLARIDAEAGQTFQRYVDELDYVAKASLSSGWRLLESRELLFPFINEMTAHGVSLADQIERLDGPALRQWPEAIRGMAGKAGQLAGQAALTGEPDRLDIAKQALTAFGTALEEAETAVEAAGLPAHTLFRHADRPRSRLYRVVMQYHASAIGYREAETQFIAIQNEALALARLQRASAHEAVNAARSAAATDAMLVKIALVLGLGWIMVALIVAWRWVTREFIRPMERLASLMREIAAGDYWAERRVSARNDIVHSMVESVETFRHLLRRKEAWQHDRSVDRAASAKPDRPTPLATAAE